MSARAKPCRWGTGVPQRWSYPCNLARSYTLCSLWVKCRTQHLPRAICLSSLRLLHPTYTGGSRPITTCTPSSRWTRNVLHSKIPCTRQRNNSRQSRNQKQQTRREQQTYTEVRKHQTASHFFFFIAPCSCSLDVAASSGLARFREGRDTTYLRSSPTRPPI